MITYCIRSLNRSALLKDQQGIAMTEAVVVLPVFIIIWMGLIFCHRTYIGQMEARTTVNMNAYQGAAIGTCDGATDEGTSSEDIDQAMDDAHATTSDNEVDGVTVDTTTLIEKAGGDSLFDWRNTIIGSKTTVTGIPKPIGGPSVEVKAKAKLMCNMKPQDGLASMLWDFLTGLF
ncbi:MAG: hypothetical protein QNJ97_09605 [Myxococcota bacterium]|nr:hypothetical protein [Myxococcota bacterium]